MARIKTGKSSAPHFVDAHIGSHIHMRRKFLNMSQETLAKGIGLTFQQIQKYERGTNRVSASTLFYIARFLKMPISYFYEGLGSDETAPGFSESESEQYVSAFLLTTEGIELAKPFRVFVIERCVSRFWHWCASLPKVYMATRMRRRSL